MKRTITRIRFGQEVTYLNKKMLVLDVYPYIAYLKDLSSEEVICVNLGDLVVAGLEPTTLEAQLLYSAS